MNFFEWLETQSVTLIFIHNRSSCLETWHQITCLQMSFSVQPWMEWNPYTLLDMWNTCDPGRWFGCPWTLPLFSHFKTMQCKWFTRFGLKPLYGDWWEFCPSGRKTKSTQQWKRAILGVNVVINFNTFPCKKCKEDWLLGVTGKHDNIHVALIVLFSPSKWRAVYSLLKNPELLWSL